MLKVGIIEKIHEDGIKLLKNNSNYEYEIIEDTSKENLKSVLPKFDAVTLKVVKLDSEILKKCPNIKVVSRHGVGYDNVDLDHLKKNNIALLITATANAVAVAEHVMYMILCLFKGITFYDKEVRSGNFKDNANKIETFELFEKEILIAGFGRIGRNLIKKCIGFNMKINVYDPYVDKDIIKNLGGNKIERFDEGLHTADILSIHMPLTKETKNLIDINKLNLMKKSSIIINTSRGGIINEKDLDSALNKNLIFGAGLDVFEKEPIQLDNPLIKNKKVLLSPHSATYTRECASRMGIETVKNIIDFFDKKIDKSMIVNIL